MARIWNTNEEVRIALNTIIAIVKQDKPFPDILLDSYRESVSKARRGQVQYFYEALTVECPEAMKYFQDVQRDGSEETQNAK